MNRIFKFAFFISIMLLLIFSSGCTFFDKGADNKKVELSIKNWTNETVQILISISKNNEIVYNQTITIAPEEKKVINEFDRGLGTYHIYLFLDENRILDKNVTISKTLYPPKFEIKNDKIEYAQKEV